ncbi:MAG: hypothetical protein GY729_14935, partial [Desulfobacteraceae bacterium]|nr:hypothetical protein [Desulfobacteraceae bacterium]
MQLTKEKIMEKGIQGIIGTGWVAGLLIAGSDSPYMPWLNGLGILIFFGAGLLMKKYMKIIKPEVVVHIQPKFRTQPNKIRIIEPIV